MERVRVGLANARAKGKRLGRPVRDPSAQARVVALKTARVGANRAKLTAPDTTTSRVSGPEN